MYLWLLCLLLKILPILSIDQISHWQNYIFVKALILSPNSFQTKLPDLANKNMWCPVKFNYYMGHSYTTNYSLLIWNSNTTRHPVLSGTAMGFKSPASTGALPERENNPPGCRAQGMGGGHHLAGREEKASQQKWYLPPRKVSSTACGKELACGGGRGRHGSRWLGSGGGGSGARKEMEMTTFTQKSLPAVQETPVRSLWGRSPGEGIGYPLPYFWASLVA